MLIALGIVIVVISLGADVMGIGNQLGIGWKQLLGAAIGIIVALIGVWLGLSKPIQKK